MIRAALIPIAICTFFSPLSLAAQDIGTLLAEAQSAERSFRDEEALQRYQQILRIHPAHLRALCRSSELYNVIGKRQTTKDKQKQHYRMGREYALHALKANPNDAEANFVMAVSLGTMALVGSGEEKIKAVKEIKWYADRCVQLDPANYKGYHVLGKWHYEVSDLSAVQRWLVKITYGPLPKSSLEDAVRFYEKSKQLFPGFLLNYLELAKAYRRKDEAGSARGVLEQMMKLPPASADDVKIKGLGRKMLDEL